MRTLAIYKYILSGNIDKLNSSINYIIFDLRSCCSKLEDSELFELRVVLNELILNAVYHGNKCDITKKVKVTTGIVDNKNIFVIIEDEGCGYDLRKMQKELEAQNNCKSVEDMKERGRGLIIVKNLCDIMRFNLKGNKVVVYKKL